MGSLKSKWEEMPEAEVEYVGSLDVRKWAASRAGKDEEAILSRDSRTCATQLFHFRLPTSRNVR